MRVFYKVNKFTNAISEIHTKTIVCFYEVGKTGGEKKARPFTTAPSTSLNKYT